MKNPIFSTKKKKFSDLQNLHPEVFRGAEADFEGPGALGGAGGPWPEGLGGEPQEARGGPGEAGGGHLPGLPKTEKSPPPLIP